MSTPAYAQDLPASVAHQLWKVDGLEVLGWMGTKEGGEVSGEVNKMKDGGSLRDLLIPGGTPSTDNITLTKLYRPHLHATAVRQLEKNVLRVRYTILGYDTDPDLGPIGQPIVYAASLLTRVARPGFDANSTDSSMLELEFTVTQAS